MLPDTGEKAPHQLTSSSPVEEVEYVGAPTEYADAEEMPGWIQTLVKVLWAAPTALAALSVIELALFGSMLACIAFFVLMFILL
ncbi:MAG TPA: hypothetical protein VHP83_25525 [Aggregatilineaceae bacterium]|nr:hypothetical protein [Aggregatilineaceae bacterium]